MDEVLSIELFHRAMQWLPKVGDDVKLCWIKLMKTHIRLLNNLVRRANHNQKVRLQSNIGHLKRYRLKLQLLLAHKSVGVTNKRSNRVRWEDVQSAFESRIRTGLVINLKHIDLKQYFDDAYFLIKARIKNILKTTAMIKVNTVFCGEFIKKSGDNEILDFKYFPTKNQVLDRSTDLAEWFQTYVFDKILQKLESFQEKESGFALHSIVSLDVNINQYQMSLGASSYIKLPEKIGNRKACINLKNLNDEYCFMWSIIAGLYPVNCHSDRITSYPHPETVFDFKDIAFPISLQDVKKFEKKNNLSVNIFSLELEKRGNFTVVPTRLAQTKILNRHVNLLLIQDKYFPANETDQFNNNEDNEDTEIKYHYVLIKNLSRLVSNQFKKTNKMYICEQCLNYFMCEQKLNAHMECCSKHAPCHIMFPEKSHLAFTNYRYKQKCPFVIYSDLESILKPISTTKGTATKYQEHLPMSVGFYLKSLYEEEVIPSYYDSYTGSDCIEWFSSKLTEIANTLYTSIKHIEPMESRTNLKPQSFCHICERAFTVADDIVVDHDHFNSKIRGLAHKTCNLNYKKTFVVPVIYHNLSHYDSHFLIKKIGACSRVSVLPLNKEKYISFTIYDEDTEIQFRFIDSLRFLASSLDNLASYLTFNQFEELKKQYPQLQDKTLKLLMKKGVFPYDYMDSVEKLEERQLPPIESFYNKLNYEMISEEQYLHAQHVWFTFNIQTLGDYMKLYLQTDVMILADVFEQFRSSCLTEYSLDPAHYFTLPGYTWDCMLKHTDINLEIIKDPDMLLFVQKGIRGGISQCSNRYSKANNKYMGGQFNPSEIQKYLLYLDVNNLYGWAMSQYLPYDGFRWSDTNIDITQIPDNGPEGYILEVDLDYPNHIHDTHKDLPFCPEMRVPPGAKLPKLLTTLYSKQKYVIHYRYLKQAMAHGLVLKKIHRVLSFKQSPWLKSYIDKNTLLRTKAKNEFEKNLFKLMNNAVFGKTMENIRKHRVVKLVNKWEGRYGAKNLIASPHFKNRTIFGENFMAIEMAKRKLVFDKPIYVGMAILDISKICLYEFHYDYILTTFDDPLLNYVDTDSLTYEIRHQDPYMLIKRDCQTRFDTSDYPADNVFEIPLVNKKIPGLLKDENNGLIMTEFVGLRSKMYSFRVNSNTVKKVKGIKKNVVKSLTFDDYVKCLFESQPKSLTQRNIISKCHNVFSIQQEKVALCYRDNKRYFIPNIHETLPWGHYSLENV